MFLSHFLSCYSHQDGETMETIFFWIPKSLQTVTLAMKLKDACSLKEKL